MTDLKQQYESKGQSHLFAHWDTLAQNEREHFLNQLSKFDSKKLSEDCQKAIALADENSSSENVIRPLPASSYESVIGDDDLRNTYQQLGLNAIKNGEVAVILMAGGQGTRLGSSAPKGCYNIGLPSGKSLFQIQAERLKRLQTLAGCTKPIQWYIMTSGPTRAATESFFKEHNFFGLSESQIHFFNQGTLPALDISGEKLFLSDKDELVESPDGNGGLYRAIKTNNLLNDFNSRGIKHIHMYCVDNVLVKIADPVFIGYAIKNDFQLATKAVRKRDAHESVGIIATKNDKPCVIEYSEISKPLAEAVDEDTGLLTLRAANIVNHYYSVDLLNTKLDNWVESMPYHIAKKKISYYDNVNDKYVKPSEPNGIKLEQFIFDVFPSIPMSRFGCLEVERAEEFSPLKNAPGTANDNPETARDAYLHLTTSWLKDVGALVNDEILVEVSSLLSYGGENLDSYKGTVFDKQGEILN
ncbi:UDP-N-acetylglucosamine diphosphorylase [Kluyveromyces lactis]|uniref:UDP-N-acetylglucosamine diphosphorylase n=1 Tax=Kluyveromyces lactis (strain ATCC 8585 / CBS 2359 / DSM 70799 / NBRC 1267 / NRRL Y-1140 / WM37) TaxID=284590 RepID=Q6CPW6_KLULA|nr:uncharacterized protein KLLA0_E01673g [Kluyveromyces lactis]CAG99110.1 KLLA0E01673p [Kluyveromyces lactis]|eukprot:XP_454023.1 uncharacterized protein KLLA0_E01673g [Kluyveromyces lactis]